MQPISPGAKRYDGTTMFFHWAVAVLVAAQWLGAQTIDWFPRGALRVDARSMHIAFGLVLGVLLGARIVWRLTRGRRLPPADRGALQTVATAVQWSLYVLVGLMVLVGILLAWARGDSIFNLFSLPRLDPGDPDLRDRVQGIHATIGWIIVGVAGLHAAAALVHRFVWRDGVLARMLPR